MMQIKWDGDHITMDGHAGDKVCCAMMTALCDALMGNITIRLGEKPEFTLCKGHFDLNVKDLGIESSLLVDAFWYAVTRLAESYPNSFRIEEEA